MSAFTRILRPHGLRVRNFAWRMTADTEAYEFYARMKAAGVDPSATIDVVPELNIVYVCVPKAASSRIKKSLSGFLGRRLTEEDALHNRRLSGLKAPHHVGLSNFYRMATSPCVLRFSFVRNPYARLVSCWADKYMGKPLLPGESFIDKFLARYRQIDPRISVGGDRTLSFVDFARFALATKSDRIDTHWQLQQELVDGPGIALDFIGRVESFDRDFAKVHDHVQVHVQVHVQALDHADLHRDDGPLKAVRTREHAPWSDYYTPELASAVYRGYERDFDRFNYPRSLPT